MFNNDQDRVQGEEGLHSPSAPSRRRVSNVQSTVVAVRRSSVATSPIRKNSHMGALMGAMDMEASQSSQFRKSGFSSVSSNAPMRGSIIIRNSTLARPTLGFVRLHGKNVQSDSLSWVQRWLFMPFSTLVKKRLFSDVVIIAILLNTVVLGIDYHGIENEPHVKKMEDICGDILYAFFLFEMIAKLLVRGVVYVHII
jgi:hypothetical protein